MKLSSVKYFFLAMIVVATGFFINPSSSFAITRDEMIKNILTQIGLLQNQLAQLQNSPDSSSEWCYIFEGNLKFGDLNKKVSYLQTAMTKEGFNISDAELSAKDSQSRGYFGESTASAVVGFQEKYKDEILTPNNLQHGTGFVGKATRVKLNQLYGCGGNHSSSSSSSQPSITVLSPNSGIADGKTVIEMKGSGFIPNSAVIFRSPNNPNGFSIIARSVSSDGKNLTFFLPDGSPGAYSVTVSNLNGTADSNSVPFTILTSLHSSSSSSSQPSITVLSPNGGETWTIGTTQTIKWQDNIPTPVCPPGAFCVSPAPRNYDIKLVSAPVVCAGNGYVCPAFKLYTIAKNVPGFLYEWSIGKCIDCNIVEMLGASAPVVPDGAYTIQVCIAYSNTCDSSNSYFKIVSAGSSSSSPSQTNPSITFISPDHTNHYALGDIMKIKWEIKNLGKSKTMFLLCKEADYNNHSKCGNILTGDNDQLDESKNQFEWKIEKSSLYYGADPTFPGKYKIISETHYGTDKSILNGSSEEFTIGDSSVPFNPSITIISPNGGEKIVAGQTYKIRYKTSGISSDQHMVIALANTNNNEIARIGEENITQGVNVVVPPNNANARYVQSSFSGFPDITNTGIYYWSVPAKLPAGSNYYIYIGDGEKMGAGDFSDLPFSIVSY